MTEERRRFAAELNAKTEEIKELYALIGELSHQTQEDIVSNDETLLRRKRVQQRIAAWMQGRHE